MAKEGFVLAATKDRDGRKTEPFRDLDGIRSVLGRSPTASRTSTRRLLKGSGICGLSRLGCPGGPRRRGHTVPDEPIPRDELSTTSAGSRSNTRLSRASAVLRIHLRGRDGPGAAADLLASGLNGKRGGWRLAPAATEIELGSLAGRAGVFGLPPDPRSANVRRRDGRTSSPEGGAGREGGMGHPQRTALRGTEAGAVRSRRRHTSSRSGSRLMLGLGSATSDGPVGDATGSDGRAPRADRRDRAAGSKRSPWSPTPAPLRPAWWIRSRRSPLCARGDLWFHVDAAYGGPAMLADDLRPLFAGIERADSIAFDPHKWLYTPQSGGCIVVRDMELMRRAFDVDYVAYVVKDEEHTDWGIDLGRHSPNFSRGFWALKVWVSLLAHGRKAYGRRISHDAELARYLGARAEEHEEFELMTPVGLSITCFRYVPTDLSSSDLGTTTVHNGRVPRLPTTG